MGCNKEDFTWNLPRENPYDGQITNTSGYEVPNKDAPKVTTGSEANISDSTSSVSGDINFVGSSEISSYGHCWSINPMPTMADAITNLGTKNSTGIFSSYLSNLSQNTTYYVRAYATNSFGTSYGNQVSFKKDAPEVTTGSATNISDSTSSVSGDIYSVGSSEISSYGHCWSINPMPTMADAITNLGTKNSTGIFSSYLSNLSQNTTYYVRAYATNSFGTSYGNQINFNTTKYEYCADFTSNITDWTSVGWRISSNPNDNTITNDWQNTGTSTLSKTFSMLPGDMSLTFSYGTYYGGDLFSNQSISVKVNSVIYFSGLSSGTEIISLPKGDCLIEFIAIDNNVSESISLSNICIN